MAMKRNQLSMLFLSAQMCQVYGGIVIFTMRLQLHAPSSSFKDQWAWLCDNMSSLKLRLVDTLAWQHGYVVTKPFLKLLSCAILVLQQALFILWRSIIHMQAASSIETKLMLLL